MFQPVNNAETRVNTGSKKTTFKSEKAKLTEFIPFGSFYQGVLLLGLYDVGCFEPEVCEFKQIFREGRKESRPSKHTMAGVSSTLLKQRIKKHYSMRVKAFEVSMAGFSQAPDPWDTIGALLG